MPAQALHCPTCGAVVGSKDAIQCGYCGTALKTVACPSCFGMMFQGAKFCPHCGDAASTAEMQSAAGGPCPRCQGTLAALAIGGVRLLRCSRCGGLWVDAAVLQHICAERETQAAAVSIKLPPPIPVDTGVRYLKCPACSRLMTRRNFAHRSGIIIDICREDGVWLDRDELPRIVEFIRAGDMDRARRVEIERLQRERQELEWQRRLSVGSRSAAFEDHDESFPVVDLLRGIAAIIKQLL